ncbi:MAG: XTP/dITP diphosphatase [Myxococcaceae bacterium]
MKRLFFATRNKGKLKELRELFGNELQVLSFEDVPGMPEVVEDQPTFEGNARKKALANLEATGMPTLADDSGLCVDALSGAPGVLSARYAEGDDLARIQKLLHALTDVPDEKRTASFRCALALALPGNTVTVEEGECQGRILHAPKGRGGFGYDPLFFVTELGKTMAEVTSEEKSRISHRGNAFRKMRPHLLALRGG